MAGTDFGINFVAGFAINIVTAIGRQARYCYQFNKLVTNLGDEQENLISTRDGMQRQLDKDRGNCREPSGNLQLQLKEANDLINKVENLKGKEKAKKSCCHGICPNWICQYIVGKKAEVKTEAMKNLNEKLGQKLSSAHRLSLQYVPPSEDFILFKCTEEARNKILMALRDDKKIRIGLCGMAGCGKTSLLREVHKEVQDSKLYKTAFVVVSNPPNYLAIQDSIANWIGLVFETEKNVPDRAARLSMAFKRDKKYLIILDNVWQVLDFEAIGIPVRENCKVLLSTRQRHIFDLMKFDVVIYLSLLTKEEAWELFQKHAGKIKDVDITQQVVQEVTDECHRLPVAIKAVASTLRGKRLFAWTEALATLKDRRRPLNIEKGLEDPYRCLKYSFDELKDAEEVSLYLLCALFPNDSDIAIEDLIRFAFGLGIFLDIDSYQRARSKVQTAIDKFKDYCLLLQEGQYVKLHDMFHALALWEANNKTQVIMGPAQIEDLKEADYMKDTNRLYCHGIEEFPYQLNCPDLEILIVSNNGGHSSKFPHMFFSKMMNLKVLAIKNTSVETKPNLLLPQSIEELKKVRTLCLRGWTLIDISMFGKLEMLDTIELLDCVMKELPKELANLKALKLLQVSNCKIGGNPYKVLATCSHLEELYFVQNHLPEMALIGQNVAEFFHQIGSYKVLKRYHLIIGGSIDTSEDHSSSKFISINHFDASMTNEAFQAIIQTLEVLFFEKIQGDCKSIIPDMFPLQGECLNELKEFVLRDSDCIKCLIDTTNDQLYQTRILFTKLQKLKVEAMKCLEAFCHGPPPSGLFEQLRELFITKCNQLASLFTTTVVKKMVMLEVLEVIDCGKLRHMITIEDDDEEISIGHVLPNLKQISVRRCENLKCILPISFASGLYQLEILEIEDTTKLQYLFGEDNHAKDQNQNQINIDLSAVKLFKLMNLTSIISVCPQNYDMKLPLDKAVVTGCPGLSGIFDLGSEVRQQDGDEAMKQAKLLSMPSGGDLRFNSFVTDLSKEKDSLILKLEGIQVTAKPLGDPLQQVQVEEARDLIKKVEKLERKAKASKSCWHGVFPNWLSRYIVGKRLEKTTKIVKQFNERLAVTQNPASSQPRITRNNISIFESRRSSYDEILVAMKDDESYMIGLWGIGGCGKTSLILEVCNEVKSLKLFDKVAMVTVSDHPDVRKIQSKIADLIGLRMEEESESERARRLYMTLNNGDKILIILDDMWEVLKLEDVGIPLGKNCKVVLTTREQHICTLMDCQKMVYLSLLSEQEAWVLFQKHAGVVEDNLKGLVLQISRECQGLPLSIIAMARALKDKPEDVWNEAFMTLRNHGTTNRSSDMENVYKSLKFSINNLGDDEARSLLFLCSIFPQDSNIALETLIRFAIGLGIFENVDSYEIARIKMGSIINELIDSLLLLPVDGKRQYFRMHDLVREVALELAKKFQVIIGPEENLIALAEGDHMKDTTRLCCHDINEYPNQLNCPKLEFLFVSNGGECLSGFSDTFFTEMLQLKVLIIIDTSIWTTPNLHLPQSMDGLKKLRTVCLRGWTLIDISILGKLEMLDTIELLYCVIKELPKELAELRRLSLLEVLGCKIGSNPLEVLTRCSQLEEIYFLENSLPKMVSNDHNVVKLLHQIGSSKVLRRYHLQIGSSIDSFKNDLITKFISVNGFNIPASNEEIKNVAQKLEVLFLKNVQGDCKNIFPDMIPIDGECMNELTEFLLHDSDNIECLIDTTNHTLYQATTVFPMLLKLKIKNMKCFKALCRGLPPSNLFEKLEELFIVGCSQLHCIVSVGKLKFCNLKHLQLEGCRKLTSIFTYSTSQIMVSLEVLKVRDCISLKHIIKVEEEDGITPVGPIFQSLKQVSIKGCQHLKFIIPASFLNDGVPPLESLEIEDAGLLKHVFGKHENEEGQNQSESNRRIDLPILKILKLVDLPNITSICPQNYDIRWPDLAKLHIMRCPQLSIASDLDSEAVQQGGGKSRKQDLELPAKQSSDMVVQSIEESKEVDEAAVGNPYIDSLSPTMASGSSEFVAIHQEKEVPSLTISTYSNEDRGYAIVSSNIQDDNIDKEHKGGDKDIPSGSTATSSNFHLLKQDGTAAEVHPHSQESQIVETQGLQKQKFCPIDSINLLESSTKIGKGRVHREIGLEESKMGTSTQELIDKQPQVELDANVGKFQDTATDVHPQLKDFDVIADTQESLQEQNFCLVDLMNSRKSNMEIAQVSFHKDPAPEESTVGTSSEVLIDKQPQIVTNPQEASLPLPAQSEMLSPSTSITTALPTSEAPGSSSEQKHQIVEELADFHGLSRCAHLPDETCVKAAGSHIHLMKQDGTSEMLPEDSHNEVQGASEFQLNSQKFDAVVDIQNSLQEQLLYPVGSLNSRESSTEIVKRSLHKDPAPEESTVGSSSQVEIELSQCVVNPQQVHEEYKVSLPLPVDPTMLSPSTNITATSLTAEALTSSSTNQHPPTEELVDFRDLFDIKERQALLLEEAFVKYSHLLEWKLSKKTLRICKVGYESLADMLAFLNLETPKTMDDSKMEEFENLYYELEYFGFDKMWLASIRQRVMDMQADHNNRLKQLDQLESQISTLEEQITDARTSLASVKDDLSKLGHVFGF